MSIKILEKMYVIITNLTNINELNINLLINDNCVVKIQFIALYHSEYVYACIYIEKSKSTQTHTH